MYFTKQMYYWPRKQGSTPLRLVVCGDCGLPMSIVMNNVWETGFKCLYASYHRKNPNKVYKICSNNYVYADISS